MKSYFGALLLGLSFLSLAILISLAKVSMYLNKLNGLNYYTDIYKYINPIEIISVIISAIIACILMGKKG
ncbi:MAG: hypothetical protein E7249_07790 [Paenibacillaceae bacterium]|nr:hypothetical protein [Paenibacillaceae bacterium]